MTKKLIINLNFAPDIEGALNDLKAQGIASSFVAREALKEYIRKHHPEIATKNNL
ncbi:hypothetical protein NXS15_01145 [Mycoplasma sp. CSL7475-4]|uniref:hypothetical protein n=1 Tax=Mycoplasma sp. CSL7475-4 TaxID=2973942 RepID=UPI00216B2764|nr:hypothetical protein [Mycoplasma sp. CSL7475-4]MCS4536736.1 hypothetical protein [Mycoplasma sp. CSL7475-4]